MQLLKFSQDNPFKPEKYRSDVGSAAEAIATIFWTKHTTLERRLTLRELTKEQRCKDPWLSHVLNAARHGSMDHETYCFMHGLPTRHTGTWMPTNDDPDNVLCGQAACKALTAQWDSYFAPAQTDIRPSSIRHEFWEERRSQECEMCTEHRRMRCRIMGCSDLSPNINENRFDDAPYIHQWNAPKYHAAHLRARHYAQRTQRILLWVVAEDKPLHKDHSTCTEAALQAKKIQWLLRHDQETGGIMGLMPLIKGMPLRITTTQYQLKEYGLFKNARCTLEGWQLNDVDEQRLQNYTGSEMKLQYLPQRLFLRRADAKWISDPQLPAGVIAITPTTAIWALDKKYKQVRVKRKGFTVASDFSGTAHSFAGATLRAAIVDCLPWNHQPSTEDQLMAYMCLSRVERIDNICVVEPFSPALFAGGDLPGPEILLKFQRGEIEQSHLQRTWAARTSARKTTQTNNWEQNMALYCRSCSVGARRDVWKPLKDCD